MFGVQQSQKAAATRERFFCHSKQNTKTVHLESLTLGGPYDGSMTMRALEHGEGAASNDVRESAESGSLA